MEDTSVVKKAVVLLLFFSTNGYGQIPLQFSSHSAQRDSRSQNGYGQVPLQLSSHSGQEDSRSEKDYEQIPFQLSSYSDQVNSHPASVVGVPRDSIVLQNLPYVDDLFQAILTLPALETQHEYSTGVNNKEKSSKPSTPSILKSFAASLKNTGSFLLSLLDLTDVDRHDSLRTVADNVNAAVDRISQLFTKFQNYQGNILKSILNIPVLGFFLQVLGKIVNATIDIPKQIFTSVTGLVGDTFKTIHQRHHQQQQHNENAVARTYKYE